MQYIRIAAALLASSSIASAQIHSSFSWVQGQAGTNFGVAHTDLDVETGELSAWCDYQGLEGDLLAVEMRFSSGLALGELSFDGLRAGFTYGTLHLDTSQVAIAVAGGYEMHFRTEAFPVSEMAGYFDFPDPVTEVRVLDAAQVVGSTGAVNATATMHLTQYASERFVLSAHTNGLDLPVTALELRGPAWFGENGPLVLDLLPFVQTDPSGPTFLIDVPAGTLSPSALRDFQEGFQYFLVRTAAFPDGALRAQMELDGFLGDNYCAGRSNSMSAIGAQLSLSGSPRIADSSLVLRGSFFPTGQFVLPLAGRGTGHVFLPGQSVGTLCLGGASLARLTDSLTQGQGLSAFQVPIELSSIPPEAGLVAGEALQFQCWYRDFQDGAATSNFSNAIRFFPR